ncbi:MAG: M48 family metalloprotease [Pseudomonadota bacterium]
MDLNTASSSPNPQARAIRRAGVAVAVAVAAAILGGFCTVAQAQSRTPTEGSHSQPAAASLPDLGSGANTILTRADERQIGRLMLRNLREENAVLDDVESSEYLQSLGSRIGAAAQDGEQQITMFVVRDPTVNAFAIPGGYIGVNTGLILLTSSESQLAGVVAHETGHVMQRHIVRAVEAQAHNSITSIAAMLGAVLIGAVTHSTDAIPGLIAMSQGAAMQQQINFTRMEEQEADRVGIGYLAAAGYDPTGMASFFAAMMRDRGAIDDFVPALLLSHPVDSARIAEARARLASLPTYARRPDSPNYLLARERIRMLMSPQDTDLRRYYEKMLVNDPGSLALKYGAALAEVKAGTPARAVEILKPLVVAHPELPLLQSELAQAQLAAGQGDEAVNTFEHGLQLAPRNVPLTVRYAQALLDLDKPKKAHTLLLDLFNVVAPAPEQIKLIALAASSAGDTGDAYYYMSEYDISNGDLMLATTQLDLAIAAPGLTEVQRKRFIARRDEIRNALREQRGDRGGGDHGNRGPPPG